MARDLRIEFKGALYHVVSRGNAGKPIFTSDEDREIFFRILKRVTSRYGFIIHAYCLMRNHYHLLIETPNANLSRGMQYLNGVYAQVFNRNNNHIGHLFHGRFKAILADKDRYLLELARYIVMNPVRAGIINDPASYRWSSYLATTGDRNPPDFLTVNFILSLFSIDVSTAQRMYKGFVLEGLHHEISFEIQTSVLLGDEIFILGMQNLLLEKKDIKEIPNKQKFIDKPKLEDIFQNIVDRDDRNRKIYRAVIIHGYTQKEVADFINLSYPTISLVIKAVENAIPHNHQRIKD